MRRYHKNCGGTIINRTCDKCGRHFSRTKNLLNMGIDYEYPEKKKPQKFDEQAYKRRIRRRDDILKR